MIEPSELDLAALRHDLRRIYKDAGYDGSLQVLYEMMVGANTFAVIIMEEWAREKGQK